MIIKNCRCFDGNEFLDGYKNIIVDEGIITGISDASNSFNGDFIDAGNRVMCPGYVDIHTHGIGGFDNSDITEEEFPAMAKLYYEAGCTTFIPSIPTIHSKKILNTLCVYGNLKDEVPGVHLEGPFINAEKRGAQNPVYIQKPNASYFKKKFGEHIDTISRVTIAPELDIGFALTRFLISKGITVSFGHTVCDSEKASEFFDLTGSIATHTFNAMPSIHHRTPSITTVALNRDNVYCEIIPDLIHVHPEIIKLIFKIKGPERTIAVSDSMLAAGLPYGEYDFSELHVTVGPTGARLDSGNLAGSTITIADGVKNIIESGVSPAAALMSGTSSPARAAGIEHMAGYIIEGRSADLLILNEDYSVDKVFKKGIQVT